jgi:hypothetical protein
MQPSVKFSTCSAAMERLGEPKLQYTDPTTGGKVLRWESFKYLGRYASGPFDFVGRGVYSYCERRLACDEAANVIQDWSRGDCG